VTNTKNTLIEARERSFPLRVRRYRLRRGSGGVGLTPGGDGIERDVEVLEDCTVSLVTERRVSAPWGLAGGEPGSPGENLLLPGGDETRAERLPTSAPSNCRGATCCASSPPAAAAGAVLERPGLLVFALLAAFSRLLIRPTHTPGRRRYQL
jgi:N-methylhydantoinase B/oxoprolinase/acetone carboxylase alpha subunit